MSKNLTRKGLALGAVVALGSSLFAGAPANAAAALTIAPAKGTTWNVLSADTFTLKATGNIDLADAQLAKLAFEVTNSAGVTLAYDAKKNAAGTDLSGESVDGTSGTASTGTSDVVKATWSTTSGDYNTLSINPSTTSTTKSATITVRAFIDVDSSGTVTADDVLSATQTIKFVSGSDVTPTAVLSDPIQSSAHVLTVTLDNSINYEQTTLTNYSATFTSNGGDATGTVTAALNADKNAITLTSTNTAAAGATIGGTPTISRYDLDSAFAEKTAVYKTTAAAGTATGSAATLANGANVRTSVSGDANYGSSAAAVAGDELEKVVRKGTKTVSFSVQFKKTNSTTNVGVGQPVKVEVIEGSDLPSGEEITAGGKTLKNASVGGNAEKVTYYTTTGTDGKVSIDLAAKTADAGTNVNVVVYSGDGYQVASAVLLSWKAAVGTSIKETAARLGTDTRVITKGSSVPVSYTVLDDFGQAFAAADTEYRVKIENNGNSTADAAFETYATLTGGKGSATIVDNSTVAGTYNIRATVQSRTSTTAWTTASVTTTYIDTAVKVVSALSVPSAITLDDAALASSASVALASGATVPLAATALVAQDRRWDTNTAYTAQTQSSGAELSGVVTTSTGANAEGVAVTISAAGVLFEKGSVSALGSITVYTGSNGVYAVEAYSKTAGNVVFTITSGSVTKTQTVPFAKAAEADAKSVTVTAVKTTKAGRAIDVTVKVLDANGNAIDTDGSGDTLDITLEGVGYSYSIPTSTNASGIASFKLIFGANETGIANITASFDADGTSSTYATYTGTAQVLVGVTASVSAGKKLATSVVKNAKGATIKVVSGAKSVTKVATSDSYKVSLTKLTAGKKTVKVYVNDVLVSSKSVTVQK